MAKATVESLTEIPLVLSEKELKHIFMMLGKEELAYINVTRTLRTAARQFPDLKGTNVVDGCRGLTVLADSLLTQLFYNLVDNSLKHGKNVSQIRGFYEEKGKDELKLVCEDDGVGMPKAEKERTFNEGHGKNSGYGLYLTRKICEAYGWTVRETGKHGKGTRFTITIPKMNESGRTSYRLH